MSKITLPSTTLTMLVGNEKENTAGGIERNLRAMLPHFKDTVVVSTRNNDGTYDVLQELSKQFPHLRVYQEQWKDYSTGRNQAIRKAKMKNVFCLDADELIADENKSIEGGFEEIKEYMENNPMWGYDFQQKNLTPKGNKAKTVPYIPTRIFDPRGVEYIGKVYEEIVGRLGDTKIMPTPIWHFLPSKEAVDAKRRFNQTGNIKDAILAQELGKVTSPVREKFH